MTTTLNWIPVIEEEGTPLSNELKVAMRLKFHGMVSKLRLDHSDKDFLDGLYHAGITDAVTLMEAIETHGLIELREI